MGFFLKKGERKKRGGQGSEILPYSGRLILLFSSFHIRQLNYSVLYSNESKIWLCIPEDYL